MTALTWDQGKAFKKDSVTVIRTQGGSALAGRVRMRGQGRQHDQLEGDQEAEGPTGRLRGLSLR